MVIGVLLKKLLKVVFMLVYFLYKKAQVFNEAKIKPLNEACNNYIYRRACGVFDVELDANENNQSNEEFEKILPFFMKLSKLISKFLFKKSITKKNSIKKKKVIKKESILPVGLKDVLSGYLSKFQALFKMLDY